MFLALFITLALWVYIILSWVTKTHREMQSRLQTVISSNLSHNKIERTLSKDSLKTTLVAHIARILVRPIHLNQARLNRINERLQQSGGSLSSLGPGEWVGIRLLACGIGLLLGLLVIGTTASIQGALILLVLVLSGWIGPDFWLSKRIQTRRDLMQKQLPSALDLLTVSVEAGLGFDQALAKVSTNFQGPLAEEFQRCLKEIQYGSPRVEALKRLSGRVALDEVRSFVSGVVQAERLGLGMAQVLRIQAAQTRQKRRMIAEERAQKAPVKMLFPLVVFVFPALFIVILGPAVLRMLQVFGHSG